MKNSHHYGKLNGTDLSHGNATAELLVENMEEETIVAQRVVFDAIRVVGMDVTKMETSNKMIGCMR